MIRRAFMLVFLALVTITPLIASAAPAAPAWHMAPPFSTETAALTLGDSVHITAEIADTDPLRSRGLGYRDGLRDGWGMLFIDPAARVQTFWMKGMRFCLDIIWIEDGQITGAAQNACPQPGAADADLAVFSSSIPVRYVLEMPANWLKDNGLSAGSSVEMTLPPSA